MKICLVTLTDNNNYGTMLQAYATAKIIQNMGHEIYFLNYHRSYYSTFNWVKRTINSKSSLLKKVIVVPFQIFVLPLKHAYMLNFLHKNFSFTKKLSSYSDVKKLNPCADMFVAGSDQIWNTDYNNGIDLVFYLDFVDDNSKKIAISSSVGQSCFDEKLESQLKSLFLKFKAITVRESLSVPLFNKLGIENVHATLDPTLMFNKDEWADMLNIKPNGNKYILVYCVEPNKSRIVIELAKKIAARKELDVYVIENGSPFRYSAKGISKRYFSPSVKKVVELFYNSAYTIVSSFHGVAFSVNFNKPFIVVKPDKYNVRVESILTDVNLTDRIKDISSEEGLSNITDITDIDYSAVNSVLDERRKKSFQLFEEMMKN